jgi:hypothetical protein
VPRRPLIAPLALVVTVSVSLVACGTGDNQARRNAPTEGVSSPSPVTTAVPAATPSTVGGCPTSGGTADVRVDYPNRMSSLIGKDVRTGSQDCFDRFVIELQPDTRNPTSASFPGYWVRYATGPVTLDPSGEPVSMPGTAILLVSMGSAMQPLTGTTGYAGPRDVVPTNVTVILEHRLVEDFEGQSTWALGLDRVRSFTVAVLDNPARLVVDVRH